MLLWNGMPCQRTTNTGIRTRSCLLVRLSTKNLETSTFEKIQCSLLREAGAGSKAGSVKVRPCQSFRYSLPAAVHARIPTTAASGTKHDHTGSMDNDDDE